MEDTLKRVRSTDGDDDTTEKAPKKRRIEEDNGNGSDGEEQPSSVQICVQIYESNLGQTPNEKAFGTILDKIKNDPTFKPKTPPLKFYKRFWFLLSAKADEVTVDVTPNNGKYDESKVRLYFESREAGTLCQVHLRYRYPVYRLTWYSGGTAFCYYNIQVDLLPAKDDSSTGAKKSASPVLSSVVDAQLSPDHVMSPRTRATMMPVSGYAATNINSVIVVPPELSAGLEAALTGSGFIEQVRCSNRVLFTLQRTIAWNVIVFTYSSAVGSYQLFECLRYVDYALLLFAHETKCVSVSHIMHNGQSVLPLRMTSFLAEEAEFSSLSTSSQHLIRQLCNRPPSPHDIQFGVAFVTPDQPALQICADMWMAPLVPIYHNSVFLCFKADETLDRISETAMLVLTELRSLTGLITEEGHAYGCVAVFVSGPPLLRWIISLKEDDVRQSLRQKGTTLRSVTEPSIGDIEQLLKDPKNTPFIGPLFTLLRKMLKNNVPFNRANIAPPVDNDELMPDALPVGTVQDQLLLNQHETPKPVLSQSGISVFVSESSSSNIADQSSMRPEPVADLNMNKEVEKLLEEARNEARRILWNTYRVNRRELLTEFKDKYLDVISKSPVELSEADVFLFIKLTEKMMKEKIDISPYVPSIINNALRVIRIERSHEWALVSLYVPVVERIANLAGKETFAKLVSALIARVQSASVSRYYTCDREMQDILFLAKFDQTSFLPNLWQVVNTVLRRLERQFEKAVLDSLVKIIQLEPYRQLIEEKGNDMIDAGSPGSLRWFCAKLIPALAAQQKSESHAGPLLEKPNQLTNEYLALLRTALNSPGVYYIPRLIVCTLPHIHAQDPSTTDTLASIIDKAYQHHRQEDDMFVRYYCDAIRVLARSCGPSFVRHFKLVENLSTYLASSRNVRYNVSAMIAIRDIIPRLKQEDVTQKMPILAQWVVEGMQQPSLFGWRDSANLFALLSKINKEHLRPHFPLIEQQFKRMIEIDEDEGSVTMSRFILAGLTPSLETVPLLFDVDVKAYYYRWVCVALLVLLKQKDERLQPVYSRLHEQCLAIPRDKEEEIREVAAKYGHDVKLPVV